MKFERSAYKRGVITDSELTFGAKCVLIAMLAFVDQDGTLCATDEDIITGTGISRARWHECYPEAAASTWMPKRTTLQKGATLPFAERMG